MGCRLHAFISAGPPLSGAFGGRGATFRWCASSTNLLTKHHQLQTSSLCFSSSGECYFQWLLLIGKKMQPCHMDFMLLVQVTGIFMFKIMHIRLIEDFKLPLNKRCEDSGSPFFTLFFCSLFLQDFSFFFLLFMWKAFSQSLSSPSSTMNNTVKQFAHWGVRKFTNANSPKIT